MSEKPIDPFGQILPLSKTKPRKPVEKTQKGRVVYDRKKHYFSDRDAKRIMNNLLFDNNVPQPDFFARWTDFMVFLLFMLAKSIAIPVTVETALALVNFIIKVIKDFPDVIGFIGGLFGKAKESE